MKRIALIAAAVLVLAVPARASVIFSDNFNTENGGVGVLNYASFANFTVSAGTVDLIGNGYFDFQPGYGLYVDLDGSTNDPGLMSTGIGASPGNYILSFDVAGSHRGTWETVKMKVLGSSATYLDWNIIAHPDVPFTPLTFPFTVLAPDTLTLSFQNQGADNVGMLLDNVQVSSVPEPATGLLLATALVATWRRSQKRV